MSDHILSTLIEGFDPEKIQQEEYDKDWQEIIGARQNNTILQAYATGIEKTLDKECLIVQVGRVRGLIPIDFSGCEKLEQLRKLVGTKVAFKVLNYDRENNLFTASRKAALEHMANVTWSRVEEGQILMSVVRDVMPWGIKVDIGGVQVEIPIDEVDYGWIDDMHEKVKVGDHLRVKVTELDKENKTIKVSAKQAKPSPWPECAKRYQEMSEYVGRVSGVREYGVFVNLEPGVDALCNHLKFEHVRKNDRVLMRVLKVDPQKEQIRGRIVRVL